MEALIKHVKLVSHGESGQDMVEYALLVGFLSLGVVAALFAGGAAINAVWTLVTDVLNSVTALL
jgi:Flp pilus assembly pilin Flp